MLHQMRNYTPAGKWKKEMETLHEAINTQPRLYGKILPTHRVRETTQGPRAKAASG